MSRALTTKVFLPFIILYFVVFIAALSGILISKRNKLYSTAMDKVQISKNRFEQLEKRDSLALDSVLKSIVSNKETMKLYKNRNREELYNLNNKTFNEIKEIYGITHWYFIENDGKVFLRMHEKGLSGDYVERNTFLRARSEKRMSSGIELGKTALALRVVEPYYDEEGVLIGYVELAQEVDHFLGELSNDTGGRYAIAVDKDKIKKEDYLSTIRIKGLPNEWDKYGNFLVINKNASQDSNEDKLLANILNKRFDLNVNSNNVLIKKFSKEYYSIGRFDFFDSNSKKAGDVYAIISVSNVIAENRNVVAFVMITLIAIFSVIFLVYRLIMNKVILNPLKQIIAVSNEASKKGFKERIKLKSSDEIGVLAENINELFSKVVESRNEITQKVLEQTKDIERQGKLLSDQQSAVINILEDVETEKEHAEMNASDLKKFQLAVSEASDHIVITDRDGIIIYANKAVERITGFSSEESLNKKAGSAELWGGLMDTDFYTKLWKTIKFDKKPLISQVKNRRKDGSIYDAAVNISPILNEGGEVIFFVGIERDITKEKEVDQAKSEFVSLASHQLRTPLSAINWYTEMLLNKDAGEINEEQESYLREIYKGNQRMVELVNSLLNVSRLELGTFEIEPKPTDLRDVTKDVIHELSSRIMIKKQKLTEKYLKDMPKVNVDPGLTRIIMQNLLSNAVKYTPNGGKINVSIASSGENYKITVSDTGYGVPKEQQEKLFEKLFRADNVKAMDTEGTGLGLYIIKSILDHSGGKIAFKSQLNKGTTFVVTIPKSGMRQRKGSKKLDA